MIKALTFEYPVAMETMQVFNGFLKWYLHWKNNLAQMKPPNDTKVIFAHHACMYLCIEPQKLERIAFFC